MLADFLKDPPGISVHGLWGNSLADWIIAAIVFAAVWASLSIVKRLIVSRHAQLVGDPSSATSSPRPGSSSCCPWRSISARSI
jgi:hypothetical protein